MKKINSINYGGKIIGLGLVIMLIVPGILAYLNTFFDSKVLHAAIIVLRALGVLLLLGFIVLLVIELRQDKKIDRYYSRHKEVKLELGNGRYECGVCGNREVLRESVYCNICGCEFRKEKDRTPQEILEDE